jgi:hypothetical protein
LLQGVLEIALRGVDAAFYAGESLTRINEGSAAGYGFHVVELVGPEVGVDGHVAAAEPFGFSEHVDEGAFFGYGGVEAVVILGGQGFVLLFGLAPQVAEARRVLRRESFGKKYKNAISR